MVVDVARSGPTRYVRAVGVTRWDGAEVVIDEALVVGGSGPRRSFTTGWPEHVDVSEVRPGPGAGRLHELLRSRGDGLGREVEDADGGDRTGGATSRGRTVS